MKNERLGQNPNLDKGTEFTPGQSKVASFLSGKGFSSDQVNALFDAGFVYGPKDVSYVLNEELTNSGVYSNKDARRLKQFFGPKNLSKNFPE